MKARDKRLEARDKCETSRRETLKIIGAVGTTCAFPFSADELYGQHVHQPAALVPAPSAKPYQPKFFTSREYGMVSRIADLIIPPTDTPGAVEAGAPQYIDLVVNTNPQHQKRFRDGLQWMDRAARERFSKGFMALGEDEQIELLTPLSDALDHGRSSGVGERFFRLMKSMTADGYFTSRIGLLQELQYKGNQALASFPVCADSEFFGADEAI